MLHKFKVITLCSLVCAGILTGCADSDSARVYSQGQTRRAQAVTLGTVVSVDQVTKDGSSNEIVNLGGAALGGLAASQLGGNNSLGNAAGGIVGALIGGFGAQAIQRHINTKTEFEVTVKLDNGRMISIVQEMDVQLVAGQRVRVLSGGGADRVVPL